MGEISVPSELFLHPVNNKATLFARDIVAFSNQSSRMAAHLPLKELTSRLLAASRPGGDGEMYGTRCERPMSVFYAPNQRADRL